MDNPTYTYTHGHYSQESTGYVQWQILSVKVVADFYFFSLPAHLQPSIVYFILFVE